MSLLSGGCTTKLTLHLIAMQTGVRKVLYHHHHLASCHNTLCIIWHLLTVAPNPRQTSTQQMLYYGYAVSEQWLLEEAVKRNLHCERRDVTVLNVAMQILYDADLLSDELSSLKKVKAKPACGGPERGYWCLALATNDRRDRLPQFLGKGIAPVPEDSYPINPMHSRAVYNLAAHEEGTNFVLPCEVVPNPKGRDCFPGISRNGTTLFTKVFELLSYVHERFYGSSGATTAHCQLS
ncbi:hypothetical protein BU15DRAFT_69538 [Melanogaster broomeanus]|nr:hypothetical protein BU15DRAFT_69538 [Melanogaster broomeanus]